MEKEKCAIMDFVLLQLIQVVRMNARHGMLNNVQAMAIRYAATGILIHALNGAM